MGKPTGDFWWLLALEAVLFFNLPFWALTAPWAEPATNPFRFSGTVLAAATAAMLISHVGPAFFAARFGHRNQPLSPLFWGWFTAGSVVVLFGWSRIMAWVLLDFANPLQSTVAPPVWSGHAVHLAFLAIVIATGAIRSWWKPVTAALLLLGSAILLWALATTSSGLWVRNPHYSGDPEQIEWAIVKGILVCAAPAIVIGWRIGLTTPEPRRIWRSGIIGLWLPLVLSLTVASLATQAGASLHWRPSLFRGFNWALLGTEGTLRNLPATAASFTMFGPALFCIVTLRRFSPVWTHPKTLWFVPAALFLLLKLWPTPFFPVEGGLHSELYPLSPLWAGVLIFLGFAAGLAAILSRIANGPSTESGQPGKPD